MQSSLRRARKSTQFYLYESIVIQTAVSVKQQYVQKKANRKISKYASRLPAVSFTAYRNKVELICMRPIKDATNIISESKQSSVFSLMSSDQYLSFKPSLSLLSWSEPENTNKSGFLLYT